MKISFSTVVVSAIGLAFVIATPAEAAKARKHKKMAAHSTSQSYVAGGATLYSGQMAGGLYNGQDYLGTDPDPNIRSYLIRDLGSRYGGGR